MPTYSDDGHQNQQYPPQYPPPPMQQPPRKPRGVIWIVVAAVLVVIAIPAGIVAWRKLSFGDDAAAVAPHGKTIEPGQPVTTQTLAEVDPATFFEAVAKRQMTQPLSRLKVSTFENRKAFLSRSDWRITDSAFDHRTGKFYYADTTRRGANDKQPISAICKDGHQYSWSYFKNIWQIVPFDASECVKKSPLNSGDGLFSSGLTPAQADSVLTTIRSQYGGYMNPAQPTLLSAGGRSYVREVVDFKPITLARGLSGGTAISMWAFRDAGLDPETWPWSNPWPLGAGIHAVYYLDTKTLLPVAAFEQGIDAPATSTDQEIKAPLIQLVNYSYPKSLPVPVLNKSPQLLTLLTPQGWTVQ